MHDTVCKYTLTYAHLNGIYQGWGVIATMNGIVYQPRELSDHLAMVEGYQLIHVWYQKNLQVSSIKLCFWFCNGWFTFQTTKL